MGQDETVNMLFRKRFEAEARGLRAIHMYYLLQSHAGFDAAGNLLGVPIVEVPEDASSNFNVPRNTFAECMDAIERDARAHARYSPHAMAKAASRPCAHAIPASPTDSSNECLCARFTGRICGEIIEAYLARLALMAASPAYEASGVTWEEAANLNAYDCQLLGRPRQPLDPNGGTWYCDPGIDNLADYQSPAEIIWRSGKANGTSDLERKFPTHSFTAMDASIPRRISSMLSPCSTAIPSPTAAPDILTQIPTPAETPSGAIHPV